MNYNRLKFEDAFLTPSADYAAFKTPLPYPDLTTGPTEVPYTKEKLITASYPYWTMTKVNSGDIKTLGKTVLTKLSDKKITEKTLFDMCRIALSLKAPNGQDVFKIPTVTFAGAKTGGQDDTNLVPVPSDTSKTTEYLQTVTSKSSTSQATQKKSLSTYVDNDANYETAIPYFLCSFLRLIVKQPESWRRAFGDIKEQYGKFYGKTSNLITNAEDDLSIASVVKVAFDTFKPIVNFIAYVAGETDKGLSPNTKEHGMFTYFVGQHLSFVGMHVYPMVAELMQKCKGIKQDLFLTFLDVDETKESVKEICRIMTTYDAPSQTDRASRDFLWKYARVIDEGFFLKLQNKKNKEFLYGLALIHEKMGLVRSVSYAKPTNMAILQNQDGLRADAEEYANLFVFLYKKATGQKEGASPMDQLRSQLAGERVTATIAEASAPKRSSDGTGNVSKKKSRKDDTGIASMEF
ncbi:N [Maize fine streak virus]|uniref:Nucleoprotein n=1 Tax=Maize fine streak virus TaxID=209854 RepID=Q6E0X8_9RHAB|nr:N [Maize fine streak nucleorhabdovirus] [Maize fine streak virus]AAT66750.1 N [Maize fine streak nucleorhabdovirus] [Maize fine streak virus]